MNILTKIKDILTSSERRGAMFLLGLMFVGMLLETLGIGLIMPSIALLMQDDWSSRYPVVQAILERLGNPSRSKVVIWAMLGLVLAYAIKNIFLAYLYWRQTNYIYSILSGLSRRLFSSYLRQPYAFYLERNSAQLVSNVTKEVDQFVEIINSSLNAIAEGVVLVGLTVLLFSVEPVGTMIVVVVLGGAGWLFIRFTKLRIASWGRERVRHDGLRMQQLQQGFGGVKDMLLLGRMDEFVRQYDVHNKGSARAGVKRSFLQQIPRLWLEQLAITGLVLVILSMLSNGDGATTILSTMGLFAAASFRLMPSVSRILNSVQSVTFGISVVDVLHKEIKLEATMPEWHKLEKKSLPHVSVSEVALNGVTYVYPGSSKPALEEISLTVRKGEFAGFIGPSGAGKSTLVDIFLGLLNPNVGTVSMNGRDIRVEMRQWQNEIGYVPQSIYLTDGTLRSNIAFGLPADKIDESALMHSIKAAQLEALIDSLSEGIETIVGERGVRLSGGQRQRIGIARALYHNPSVIVLDEATSALDMATEASVMEAVKAFHGEKTILIIAHRLSTVECCDRIYRMEGGKIVAVGNPSEML